MKIKTTAKAVRNSSANLVSVGYCDLAALLRYHSPIAYTAGIYGWNFDVYEVYGVTICTGYRNMPGRTANKIHEYNAKAEQILKEFPPFKSDETEERIEALLKEFCEQA